jgi:hypothetical protein
VVGVWRVDVFGVAIWCVCSHRGSMRMVALGECKAVVWALVIACSMARRMHSWSYSGLAMFVPCHVCMVRCYRWMRRLCLRGIVSGKCKSVGIC